MSEVSSNNIKNISIVKMVLSDIITVQKIENEGDLSPWSFEGYKDELNNEDSLCLCARLNNEIVGFIIARLIMSNYSIDIYNIGVLKDYRRLKIATNLLNEIDNIFKIKNLHTIHLEVRESNFAAIKFYEKNNFKKIGKRKSFYNNPVENAILMVKVKDS